MFTINNIFKHCQWPKTKAKRFQRTKRSKPVNPTRYTHEDGTKYRLTATFELQRKNSYNRWKTIGNVGGSFGNNPRQDLIDLLQSSRNGNDIISIKKALTKIQEIQKSYPSQRSQSNYNDEEMTALANEFMQYKKNVVQSPILNNAFFKYIENMTSKNMAIEALKIIETDASRRSEKQIEKKCAKKNCSYDFPIVPSPEQKGAIQKYPQASHFGLLPENAPPMTRPSTANLVDTGSITSDDSGNGTSKEHTPTSSRPPTPPSSNEAIDFTDEYGAQNRLFDIFNRCIDATDEGFTNEDESITDKYSFSINVFDSQKKTEHQIRLEYNEKNVTIKKDGQNFGKFSRVNADFEDENTLFATLKSQCLDKGGKLTVPETKSRNTFKIRDTSSEQYITVTANRTNDDVSFNYKRNGKSETVNFLYKDGKLTKSIDWSISFDILNAGSSA